MSGIKRGFSIIEYSILTAVVLAAFSGGMHIYLKRAVQGRLKASTDAIGEQFSAANSDYNYTLTVKSKRQETTTPQGLSRSELLEPEIIHRSSYTDYFSDKKLSEEKLFE